MKMTVAKAGPYLAIDWGTTNRRAYRIAADGAVEETRRDDRGILAVAPGAFAAELAEIRDRLGDLPALCAGMVGSNRGWTETPYATAPCAISALSRGLCWVEPERTAIVPGIVLREGARADVMRGEEVQFFGAAHIGAPRDALLCQPGTHAKWARMADGRIEWFATAMTGELYSLLQQHSLIGAEMTGMAIVGEAFLKGVCDAGEQELLTRLFGVRAARVSGISADQDASSYVSGLLIGTDVRARVDRGRHAYVLADRKLGALYLAAIGAVGGHCTIIDSHAAFVAGIHEIWSSL